MGPYLRAHTVERAWSADGFRTLARPVCADVGSVRRGIVEAVQAGGAVLAGVQALTQGNDQPKIGGAGPRHQVVYSARMDWIADPQVWIALATLTVLEVVLGVDNVIFISILAGKLPEQMRAKARRIGLSLALIIRIALLFSLSWIVKLTTPLFNVMGNDISGRDLILLLGGLFLLAKSTHEIHQKMEGDEGHTSSKVYPSFSSVIAQIVVLDLVFSLDSVITAVGMVNRVEIMIAAVVIAVGFMITFAGAISGFVDRHPTVKMLALSFLLLIGLSLIAEGLDHHIPKGYIYFAMAFSVFVELLNLKMRKSKSPPVHLREAYSESKP